jgi:hypothetical protein
MCLVVWLVVAQCTVAAANVLEEHSDSIFTAENGGTDKML